MSKWISVKDRLPKFYGDYAIYQKGRINSSAGNFTVDNVWKWRGIQVKDVTHWQELPKPPKTCKKILKMFGIE
jgi:hypothetical protein